MTNVYDQGGRYLIKRNPKGFYSWRVPRYIAAFTFVGWADTRTLPFPGEPDRVCDTVAEFVPANGQGPRRLLDTEVQAEPDGDFLERAGEYGYRLRRELRFAGGQAGKYH